MHGPSSTSSQPYNAPESAAPASGKYGGFGSEDIDKFGYKAGKFNNVYDPYSKKAETEPSKKEDSKQSGKTLFPDEDKKKKKKKKNDSDSDDDSASDLSATDSDDSEDAKKKKKKQKAKKQKQKSAGLSKAPLATRNLDQTESQAVQPKVEQPVLFDLDSFTTPSAQIQQQPSTSSGFDFFSGGFTQPT